MPPPIRKSPLPNAAQRLTNIETSLSELAGIVSSLPTEGEARRLRQVHTEVRRITVLLLIPVAASLMFMVLGTISFRDAKAATKQNYRGIRCELAQLFEHRVTNQEVHDRMAAALHVDPTPSTPLPPRFPPELLTEACRPFFPPGQ